MSLERDNDRRSGAEPWQEPRLDYVEPKLTRDGDLKKVTGGDPFFGPFSP